MMTREQRQAVKKAIDRRRRELIADDDTPRCGHCEGEFEPTTWNQTFCSRRCRDAARFQREGGYWGRKERRQLRKAA